MLVGQTKSVRFPGRRNRKISGGLTAPVISFDQIAPPHPFLFIRRDRLTPAGHHIGHRQGMLLGVQRLQSLLAHATHRPVSIFTDVSGVAVGTNQQLVKIRLILPGVGPGAHNFVTIAAIVNKIAGGIFGQGNHRIAAEFIVHLAERERYSPAGERIIGQKALAAQVAIGVKIFFTLSHGGQLVFNNIAAILQ